MQNSTFFSSLMVEFTFKFVIYYNPWNNWSGDSIILYSLTKTGKIESGYARMLLLKLFCHNLDQNEELKNRYWWKVPKGLTK